MSFETARLVFEDPFAVTAEDYIDENGEIRYQPLGQVDGLLIFVAHVYRLGSRRKALDYLRTKGSQL